MELLPQPLEGQPLTARKRRRRSSELVAAPAHCPPLSSSKTVSDQYGKYSYVKGSLRQPEAGYAIINARNREAGPAQGDDRQLYRARSRALLPGDIEKRQLQDKKTVTIDTLCAPKVVKVGHSFPSPCCSVTITPRPSA